MIEIKNEIMSALFLETKQRFKTAFNSKWTREQYMDVVYFMNMLNLIKPFDEKTTAQELNSKIDKGEY